MLASTLSWRESQEALGATAPLTATSRPSADVSAIKSLEPSFPNLAFLLGGSPNIPSANFTARISVCSRSVRFSHHLLAKQFQTRRSLHDRRFVYRQRGRQLPLRRCVTLISCENVTGRLACTYIQIESTARVCC